MLSSHVLVLNRNYDPVWITTAKKAFIKLFNGVAEAIVVENGIYCNHDFGSWAELSELKKIFEETDEDDWVYSEKLALIVPRVIRCLGYDKPAIHDVKLTRRNVFARDEKVCQYCGKKHNTKDLQLDHVIPGSRGGKNTWKNLVCACFACNSKKANRTPEEAGMRLVRKPLKPKYSPLFNLHIRNEKYSSWKNFLNAAYWDNIIKE